MQRKENKKNLEKGESNFSVSLVESSTLNTWSGKIVPFSQTLATLDWQNEKI